MAPLQDDMILGIDFLQNYGVRLHCGTGELQLGDSAPVLLMHKNGVGSVKAVSVRRVRLPPFSVGVVELSVSRELLEPVDNFPSSVLPARSFNKSGKSGKLCLINMTQRSHVFKAGQELAAATVASEVESKPFTVRGVETGENSEAKQHIRGLLEDVREHAPPDVRDEAVRLVTEFADVFATSDLDLGSFDALEHQIDTGDARPVKQRMRSHRLPGGRGRAFR